MKILHILDHSIPLHSGYTFRTRAILEQQRKLGWKTFHVTSGKHTIAKSTVEDVDSFSFYRSAIPEGIIARFPVANQFAIIQSLTARLDEIIPEIQPDILHAHSPALNGFAAIRAGKKHNIPVVYECRAFWEDAAVDHGTAKEGGLRYRMTHALESYVFRRANAVTTICQGLKKDIIKRGIAPNKVTVIPNAVDIEKFAYNQDPGQELRQELGLEDKSVLGFIGSFYAYEGLPILLEAMPDILKAQPNTRILLVGGGPQENLLKQKVEALKLNQQVIFIGRVPHEKVQDYYNLVDIFIYPRLSMRLTNLVTPLKPLEAMAQGRLVIASDVGGHKELIKDDKTGYFFKAGDKTALSSVIIDLLGNQQNWERLKNTARQFVEQERNWPMSVSGYQAVYSRLVQEFA